jgi:hypothetical protein
MVDADDVVTAFQLVLGREPESKLAIQAHSGAQSLRDLHRLLITSQEFVGNNIDLLSYLPCIYGFKAEWLKASHSYYEMMGASTVTNHALTELYQDGDILDDYAKYHLTRFKELFSYIIKNSQNYRRQEILEIGTSEHTSPFYTRFIDCRCDTVCRPIATGGPTREWAEAHGIRNHWEVDLNDIEGYRDTIERIPESYYDLVICCEVIEHLIRPPRDVIRLGLSKLKTGGLMLITTPNAITPDKISNLYHGSSLTIGFEDYKNNVHAHHHFKEYSAQELVWEALAAHGGAPQLAFSHCWDKGRYQNSSDAMFRANIVMEIRKEV